MEFKEIKNRKQWEGILSRCGEKTFLQSWNWGEFQKSFGNKIWRLAAQSGKNGLAAALTVKIKAKRGTFLFVPHGPAAAGGRAAKKAALASLLEKLKRTAAAEGASFIRIAPVWENKAENREIFKSAGFRDAPMHIHPELTWELDLTPPESRILANMRKTTRYLIRQGLKNKDIVIAQSGDIAAFGKIYRETARRQKFIPFSPEYLQKEFRCFFPDKEALLFIGKYKGDAVCGAMVIFWQGAAFYHQGASLLKYPKVPVSYLTQWKAITEAKKRGCRVYNFWGIAPASKPSHPWKGLTLFKKGFGGAPKEYVRTKDFVLSPKYWPAFALEKLRKIKRGL